VTENITLMKLLRLIIRHWRTLLMSTVVIVFIAILYLNITPHKYTITLDVIPVAGKNNPLADQFSGSSSILAGVTSSASTEADPFKLFLEAVYTHDIAARLAKRPEIMKLIFKDQWDQNAQQWREAKGMFTPIKNAIKWTLGMPTPDWTAPSGLDVQKYFIENVIVITDRKSPVAVVALDHKRPEIAKKVLQALYEEIDGHLREQASTRSRSYIEYLENRLSEVKVIDYRQAILNSIAQQESTLMRTSPNTAFSAAIFDGPIQTLKPTSPKALIIFILAFFVGYIIGIIIIIAREPRLKLTMQTMFK